MRAAFFGEVAFPRSRAVDVDFGDDFDEDVSPRNEACIEVKDDIAKTLSTMKYLFIACGFHPSNFAKVHLIPNQPQAEVAFSVKVFPLVQGSDDDASVPEPGNRPAPTSVLDFYCLPSTNSLVGVTVSKYAPSPEAAHAVVAKVFERLGAIASSIRVFVLEFKPSALYQTFDRSRIEDRLSTYGIVRVLMSSKEKSDNKDSLLQLEMPNMVDGLAGEVMTHCELNGIRAMVIILYGPDSADATSANISVYRTSLERAELWKSLFLSRESESIIQSKLAALLRKTVPLNSVFG